MKNSSRLYDQGYFATSILAALVFLLAACAGPRSPAPVTVLNSQNYPEELPQQTTYTVQPGDTLYAIAWYTDNDYADIARWNQLTSPDNIYPGQILNLQPPSTASETPHPVNKMTGQTSKNNTKKSIDQRDSEAYCNCEPNVNSPASNSGTSKESPGNKSRESKTQIVNNGHKKPNQGFPQRVEHWRWPATGRTELTNTNDEATKTGLDIYAQHGSRINAAAAGKVVYAGNALRGYGNLIIIKHTDSFLSAYAHNSRILVKERDWVNAGQKIAEMGDTGTTSVKLHFEIRYRGKAVEPMKYLPVTHKQ